MILKPLINIDISLYDFHTGKTCVVELKLMTNLRTGVKKQAHTIHAAVCQWDIFSYLRRSRHEGPSWYLSVCECPRAEAHMIVLSLMMGIKHWWLVCWFNLGKYTILLFVWAKIKSSRGMTATSPLLLRPVGSPLWLSISRWFLPVSYLELSSRGFDPSLNVNSTPGLVFWSEQQMSSQIIYCCENGSEPKS